MYLRVETRIPTTRVSISVLTIVMGTHRMSERDKDTSKHQRARLCPAHPRGVEGTRKKNIQVTGEHRCARPCPAHPQGVEGTRKMTHRTRTGTGVLACVLRVHGVSKRQEKDTGHEQAPVCSLVSCGSTRCRRDEKKDTRHKRALVCSLVSYASTGCRRDNKKDLQDMSEHQCARSHLGHPRHVEVDRDNATHNTSEHQCARSCPGHPRRVEKVDKWTHKARTSTVCSFVSSVSARCRRR